MSITLTKIDGKIEYNKPHFIKVCEKLKNGDYKIDIKTTKKTRSERQNKYYWGYILKTYSEHVGATSKETHDFLREEIISYNYECPVAGQVRTRVKSTTELSTKEFELYLEQIRARFYEEYRIDMKLPNETEFNY